MAKQKDKARQYKPSTVRRLDTLSGNQCAKPGCLNKLIAEDGASIISKICHIAAASENGPRYDANMTDDERRAFENLILLCDEHHTIIDNKENESEYTVELLKEWKASHELKTLEMQSQQQPLSTNPLALNRVIDSIAKNIEKFEDSNLSASRAPNTDSKISHNNIVRYSPIIKQMSLYQGKLNKVYAEIEKQGSTKKFIILSSIQRIYQEIKVRYSDIEDIKAHADSILDEVTETLLERIGNATNSPDGIEKEVVEFALEVIIVDAFIRCKILEEPNDS